MAGGDVNGVGGCRVNGTCACKCSDRGECGALAIAQHTDAGRGKMVIGGVGVQVLHNAHEVVNVGEIAIIRHIAATENKRGEAVGVQPLRGGHGFLIRVAGESSVWNNQHPRAGVVGRRRQEGKNRGLAGVVRAEGGRRALGPEQDGGGNGDRGISRPESGHGQHNNQQQYLPGVGESPGDKGHDAKTRRKLRRGNNEAAG